MPSGTTPMTRSLALRSTAPRYKRRHAGEMQQLDVCDESSRIACGRSRQRQWWRMRSPHQLSTSVRIHRTASEHALPQVLLCDRCFGKVDHDSQFRSIALDFSLLISIRGCLQGRPPPPPPVCASPSSAAPTRHQASECTGWPIQSHESQQWRGGIHGRAG